MPFDSAFDDIYKFGIKEPAAKLNIKAERVDEQIYSEVILERIYQQIDVADIIIADMSGQNPNVFYEVGYAHAKEKTCILLTSNAEDIPFDLKHRRHIIYKDSIQSLSSDLTEELKWAIQEIEKIKSSHIQVSIKDIVSDLDKTKYYAYANLTFKIDMDNKSQKISPEIEAAYLYTGSGWSFKQEGIDCPSKDSDTKPFLERHFLNMPVRKFQPGQWAQLVFEGKKLLANAFLDQEIKNNYKISGHAMLRLVTSKGNFDYKIPVEVEIDEIPF